MLLSEADANANADADAHVSSSGTEEESLCQGARALNLQAQVPRSPARIVALVTAVLLASACAVRTAAWCLAGKSADLAVTTANTNAEIELAQTKPGAELCVNRRKTGDNFCDAWAKQGHCAGEHAEYMSQFCCHSCAIQSQAPPAECKDAQLCSGDQCHCKHWKNEGYCESSSDFYHFVQEHCCATCAAASSHAGNTGCVDKTQNCSVYAREGHCQMSPEYMAKYCCAACAISQQSQSQGDAHCKALSAKASKKAALNVVLLPSAFHGNMELFKQEAEKLFKFFSRLTPLNAAKLEGLNIFYVDEELPSDDGKQCWFNCQGIPRLLCCRDNLFERHAERHCGSGLILSILVVHNEDVYGGSGGRVATVSTHKDAPGIAAHELGHSLFGLGDEYVEAPSAGKPNCDSSSNCPKWRDLIGRHRAECVPHKCKQGRLFASGETIMYRHELPFGAVNDRIACCKYLLYVNSAMPAFCEEFDKGGLSLRHFCQGQVWRNRVTSQTTVNRVDSASSQTAVRVDGQTATAVTGDSVDSQRQGGSGSGSAVDSSVASPRAAAAAADRLGLRHVYVEHPVQWMIERTRDTPVTWACSQTMEHLEPGLYAKEAVMGDASGDLGLSFVNAPDAPAQIKVEVLDLHGRLLRRLAFDAAEPLEAPFAPGEAGAGQVKWQPRGAVNVVLNEGEICDVGGL